MKTVSIAEDLGKVMKVGTIAEEDLKSALSVEFADKNKIHDLYEEVKKNAKVMDSTCYDALADELEGWKE